MRHGDKHQENDPTCGAQRRGDYNGIVGGASHRPGPRRTRFKLQAFALGAGIMGVAGALYGHYTSYIAPDLFRPVITIYIFLALTAGGTGNNVGAVVVPGLSGVQVAALREFLIGVGLIVVLRFRPAGLVPERLPKHALPMTYG